MVPLTYYEILGVPMNANAAAIHKAYKERFAQWHPSAMNCDNDSTCFNPFDKVDQIRFKWLQRAYHVLGNAVTRNEYDRHVLECGLHPPVVKISAISLLTQSEESNVNLEEKNNNNNISDADTHTVAPEITSASTSDNVSKSVHGKEMEVKNLNSYVKEHIDPTTNSKYVYFQSPDGRSQRFEYYYNSANDPSLMSSLLKTPCTRNQTVKNETGNNESINNMCKTIENGSHSSSTKVINEEKTSSSRKKLKIGPANFTLPRRVQVMEEQLKRLFQPLTNSSTSAQSDLLAQPVTSLYVLTEEHMV